MGGSGESYRGGQVRPAWSVVKDGGPTADLRLGLCTSAFQVTRFDPPKIIYADSFTTMRVASVSSSSRDRVP